jgi:hypothetical protein
MNFYSEDAAFNFLHSIKYTFSCVASLVFILFVVSSLVSAQSEEEPPIKFAGTYVPILLDNDYNDGLYLKLFHRIQARSDREIELSIMPIRRAQSNFFKGLFDCVFVATQDKEPYLNAGMKPGSFLVSDYINKLKMKAYVAAEASVIENLDQLKHMVLTGEVGAIQAFAREFPDIIKATSVLPVESVSDAMALIDEGRAEVVISFDLDLRIFLDANVDLVGKYKPSSFDVLANNESVVCKNTNVGHKIINIVNDILLNEPPIKGFSR